MQPGDAHLAAGVFAATLTATFAFAWLGRRHTLKTAETQGLSDQRLNRWLIGLSAGAAANSGFVVTGAVGLGYSFGVQWLLLPFGWLLGDILFWSLFPSRLNALGRRLRATTISDLLCRGLEGRAAAVLGLACAFVVLVCLGGYVAAQWLAGQKFLAGAVPIPPLGALGLFSLMIVGYTAIGGFRGSVYVDSLQAVIRILGTALALVAVFWVASREPAFHANLAAAGDAFLRFAPTTGALGVVGILIGFGAAALGFGLGQPHLVSRYLAGADPAETRAAWWIYILFVQFTWASMTVFGVVLRGVMPGLADPEAGLSAFFGSRLGGLATGLILADVFATIAATSNSLLVAMSQVVVHDVLPRVRPHARLSEAAGCILMGALTMGLSLLLDSSVMGLALSSVSMMAAGVSPAVMTRVMGWPHDARSLLAGMLAGLGAAIAWKVAGYDGAINQAAPGIVAGLLVNRMLAPGRISDSR